MGQGTDPERWARVEAVFHAALEVPEDQRDVFVAGACGGDADLQRDVLGLLREASAAPAGWDDPLPAMCDAAPGGAALKPGDRLGRYEIRRLIGAGGMGSVYEAVQDVPNRSVALKVLRADLVTHSMRRRFEQEAEILARLRHPNIAQIYDAGMLDAELAYGPARIPYIAMEFVPQARTITAYCNEQQLDVAGRLSLFLKACEAVQHGHAQGIIHRDLKPANVLVDGSGEVKVIDFGVARVAGENNATRVTAMTSVGQIVGTIAYMAPEQCAGDPNELDIRSDVYALGIVLFELLSGRLPFDIDRKMLHEALRIVREGEPTRLGTVNRSLRGDLENIVGTALAKEKPRRYQTASDLAADIRRFLKDQPIFARPPSTWYQFSKFAKRNRGLVASAGVIALALTAGTITSTLLYLDAEEARRAESIEKRRATSALISAEQARDAADISRNQAEKARDVAQQEARKTLAALEFLRRIIRSADPAQTLGERLTLRQALDLAAEDIQLRLADEPAVRAVVRSAIADAYKGLDMKEAAITHQRAAIEEFIAGEGAQSVPTASARVELATTLFVTNRFKECIEELDKAEPILAKAEGTVAVSARVRALTIRGRYAYIRGQVADAEALMRRAVAEAEAHRQLAPFVIGPMYASLAEVLRQAGKPGEALDAARLSLEMAEREYLRDDVLAVLDRREEYASCLLEVGRIEEADALSIRIEQTAVRLFGTQHRRLTRVYTFRAKVLARQSQFDEAVLTIDRAYEIARQTTKPPSAAPFGVLQEKMMILDQAGRRDAVIEVGRAALTEARATFKPESFHTIIASADLGMNLAERNQAGDRAEALPLLQFACAKLDRDPARLDNYFDRRSLAFAACLEDAGQIEEARTVLLKIWEWADPRGTDWTQEGRVTAATRIAEFFARRGAAAEEAAWREKAAHAARAP